MRYVTRSEWNARVPRSTTPFRSRRGIAIHWVGGKVDLPDFAAAKAHVQSIQADHMEGRNSDKQPWADIAYNFLIWRDVVFEGRGWDNRSAANGNTDANADYLAICQLISTDEPFNDDAKATTAELIGIGQEHHGVDSEVWPHSHFFVTACPGDDVRAWIAAKGYERPTAPSTTPSIQGDDDMADALTITYPNGTKTIATPDGAVKNAGTRFFGSIHNLKPEDKKDWTGCFAITAVDPNNADAGYTLWNVSPAGSVQQYTFDENEWETLNAK